jgi:hypothetical protein
MIPSSTAARTAFPARLAADPTKLLAPHAPTARRSCDAWTSGASGTLDLFCGRPSRRRQEMKADDSAGLARAFFRKPAVAHDLGDDLLGRADESVFCVHRKLFRLDVFCAIAAGHFVLRSRH